MQDMPEGKGDKFQTKRASKVHSRAARRSTQGDHDLLMIIAASNSARSIPRRLLVFLSWNFASPRLSFGQHFVCFSRCWCLLFFFGNILKYTPSTYPKVLVLPMLSPLCLAIFSSFLLTIPYTLYIYGDDNPSPSCSSTNQKKKEEKKNARGKVKPSFQALWTIYYNEYSSWRKRSFMILQNRVRKGFDHAFT